MLSSPHVQKRLFMQTNPYFCIVFTTHKGEKNVCVDFLDCIQLLKRGCTILQPSLKHTAHCNFHVFLCERLNQIQLSTNCPSSECSGHIWKWSFKIRMRRTGLRRQVVLPETLCFLVMWRGWNQQCHWGIIHFLCKFTGTTIASKRKSWTPLECTSLGATGDF